jgi:hypothetical protein
MLDVVTVERSWAMRLLSDGSLTAHRVIGSASVGREGQERFPRSVRARSSVGERLLHTQEVGGSKPPAPTT